MEQYFTVDGRGNFGGDWKGSRLFLAGTFGKLGAIFEKSLDLVDFCNLFICGSGIYVVWGVAVSERNGII